ncbi:MAG: OsmC family protein [Armatimonadetes bacterium]|nr:OsmC family protein [Armatimonadota bacterium]
MKFEVKWIGDTAFRADPPSGVSFVMDSHAEFGGSGSGPSPIETLLSSAAACSGIDVLSILKKKRQPVDSYTIEVSWERGPHGEWPRPITSVHLKHIVRGSGLSREAVERAVQLSDEKYCSVVATLRIATKVTSNYEIEP